MLLTKSSTSRSGWPAGHPRWQRRSLTRTQSLRAGMEEESLNAFFSVESALVGGPPWPGDGCDGRLGALDACLCKARLAVAEQTLKALSFATARTTEHGVHAWIYQGVPA